MSEANTGYSARVFQPEKWDVYRVYLSKDGIEARLPDAYALTKWGANYEAKRLLKMLRNPKPRVIQPGREWRVE